MREIALTKGYSAYVDDKDYERVVALGPWFASVRPKKVYAIRNNRDDGFTYMHQVVLNQKWVDHENGAGLDNQSHNLRSTNRQQNAANIAKSHPFKGTTWDRFTRMWKAQIMVAGKHINLGRFVKRSDAAAAYDAAAVAYFGDFANVNT